MKNTLALFALFAVLFGCTTRQNNESTPEARRSPPDFSKSVGEYKSNQGEKISIFKEGDKLFAQIPQFNEKIVVEKNPQYSFASFRKEMQIPGCAGTNCYIAGSIHSLSREFDSFSVLFSTGVKFQSVPYWQVEVAKPKKPSLRCFTKFFNREFTFSYEGQIDGDSLKDVWVSINDEVVYVSKGEKGSPHQARDERYKNKISFGFTNMRDLSQGGGLLLPEKFSDAPAGKLEGGFVREKAGDGGSTSSVLCTVTR